MAEETSLKAPGPNRAIRGVVGVAAIGVLLAALAWMIPHFIAQPARATLTQETPTGMCCASSLKGARHRKSPRSSSSRPTP